MNFEYYSQILNQNMRYIEEIESKKSELNKLKEQKKELKKKKEELNKIKKRLKETENKLKDLYETLCCQNEPALFFQYLKARVKDAEGFRNFWIKKYRKILSETYKNALIELEQKIIPKINAAYISILPKYSFAIQFKFKLAKPYISKDDREFYILDNPVKKEWVFKIPMVSPSTWKGNLRWIIRKIKRLTDEPFVSDDDQLIRLFGNEREEENTQQGCLIFYPTFFYNIGVEVINPHDRKVKAGKWPIFIEVVPEDTKGTFTLVYVPQFGEDPSEVKENAKQDLDKVVKAIKAMMFEYGFSAKKGSGYGIIKDELNSCQLIMNGISLSFDEIKSAKFEFFKERKDLIVKELKKD
ncbi:MAG TPA: hypothetical protein ENI51_01355 [Candidatus Atribacteria bacterium]|nr:hypothetical protein [Candidatus Atribacteria bacterium]